MNRRDFLAWVSSAGVGAAVGGLGTGCRPDMAAGGRVRTSPHRQGVGYAVRLELELPGGRELTQAPPLVVVRDGVPDWWAPVEAKEISSEPGRWVWEWAPPIVPPTAVERHLEVMRYRVLALDERGRPLDLACEPVEVVCARRGWGC